MLETVSSPVSFLWFPTTYTVFTLEDCFKCRLVWSESECAPSLMLRHLVKKKGLGCCCSGVVIYQVQKLFLCLLMWQKYLQIFLCSVRWTVPVASATRCCIHHISCGYLSPFLYSLSSCSKAMMKKKHQFLWFIALPIFSSVAYAYPHFTSDFVPSYV